MRLIDADALKKSIPATRVDGFENCRYCTLLDEEQIKQIIDEAPTIDAVQVVRCKDCKYKEAEENGMVYCSIPTGGWVDEDWFCGDGEREKDE